MNIKDRGELALIATALVEIYHKGLSDELVLKAKHIMPKDEELVLTTRADTKIKQLLKRIDEALKSKKAC